MPLEVARCRLAFGVILRRSKRRGAAASLLGQAKETFDGLGAAAWGRLAEAEIDRLGLRRSEDELTPTELRIAELVASGRKNREVAEALFISPKTVEANLARIYRKLGIKSRAELGRHMGKS
jgi:DNA-binding CsgD family transcriptional regulator